MGQWKRSIRILKNVLAATVASGRQFLMMANRISHFEVKVDDVFEQSSLNLSTWIFTMGQTVKKLLGFIEKADPGFMKRNGTFMNLNIRSFMKIISPVILLDSLENTIYPDIQHFYWIS